MESQHNGKNKAAVTTINPATEEKIADYDYFSKEDINKTVEKSKKAFTVWKSSLDHRIRLLHALSENLRKNKEHLAKLATKEMGKPIKEARSEVEKCAWVIEFYADNGGIFSQDDTFNTDARKSVIKFSPVGVIASIMPWNFPYWQALRFAAPSLALGNTIVLKPASATTQCGIEIQKMFENSGFDDGVFQAITGTSYVAADLISDKNVNGVTFTGSTNAGSKVATEAGRNIKKCVLELGGSDPFIVCSDADVETASDGGVKGRFINTGQSCIASKRFIVQKDIADEFIEKFVKKTEKLVVGDPLSDHTDIGPLVNSKALENIEGLVKDATKNGAKVLTGGTRFENSKKGFFYKPTVVRGVTKASRLYHEEAFGPVASIIVAKDDNEAISIANDTEFGLGSSVWTRDLDRAERMVEELEAGMVSVNNVLASDPRVPFGGVKNSGFGRELSRYGMMEFANIKSVRYYDKLVHYHHVE